MVPPPTYDELEQHNENLNSMLGEANEEKERLKEERKEQNERIKALEKTISEMNQRFTDMKNQLTAESAMKQQASPPAAQPTGVLTNAVLAAEIADLKKQLAEKEKTDEVSPQAPTTEELNAQLTSELAELKKKLAAKHEEKLPESSKSHTTPVVTIDEKSDGKKDKTNIKYPAFMHEDPELWFLRIEHIFNKNNISAENAKYQEIVGSLDGRASREVKDLIREQPTTKPYTTIKNALIKRLLRSEDARILDLLSEVEIGDSTPSQYLRRLKDMAGPNAVTPKIMKSLWMRGIPTHIRMFVSAEADKLDLEELAERADRVAEQDDSKTRPSVFATTTSALSQPQEPPPSSQTMQLLIDRIDKLESKIESKMETKLEQMRNTLQNSANNNNPKPQWRPKAKAHPRSNSPNTQKYNGYCWYHNKFGARSTRCVEPCQFPKNSNGTSSSTNAGGSQ